MKSVVLLLTLTLASCAQFSSQQSDRTIASAISSPIRLFLEAAISSSDNIYRSVDDMERKLLKEIQMNPSKYGIPSGVDVQGIKSLDELPTQRAIAEVLNDAPRILRFSNKTKTIAFNAIKSEAGIASRITLGTTDLSHVKVSLAEETGLGRRVSQQIKDLETSLVTRKLASTKEAKEIADNIFESARELAKMSKSKPELKAVSRQIVEYSTAISQKTGKKFLGKGGCFKITGADALENKAEIAYRMLKEVDEHKMVEYDEIGPALQKHHAEVTNRTRKESCKAIRALSVGPTCGNIYARNLAPSGC